MSCQGDWSRSGDHYHQRMAAQVPFPSGDLPESALESGVVRMGTREKP